MFMIDNGNNVVGFMNEQDNVDVILHCFHADLCFFAPSSTARDQFPFLTIPGKLEV